MKSDSQYKQTEIGEIPVDWKTDSLKNHLVIKGRIGWKGLKKSEYLKEGFAIINGLQIKNWTVDWSSVGRISKERYDESPEIMLQPNDILMTKDGTIGKIAFLKDCPEPATVASGVFVIRNNSKLLDQRFLFHYFKSSNFKELVQGRIEGAVIPHLYQRDINEMYIPLPKITEQQQIASILSSLDDKIELNRRMNKTLEEIGKALFKQWFVDFEFPNENGEPYKSSGGEMVDSELGMIPKGWKIAQLKDFGEIVCGKTPPKSNKDFFNGDVPFIKIPDMHGNTFIVRTEDSLSQDGLNHQKNKTLPEGSICVSCIATVGLVSITSKTSQTNQQINSIIPKSENTRAFLYYTMKQMEKKLQDYASGGSATLNLNTGSFSAVTVNKPSNNTLNEFHQITEQIFHQILLNIEQISKLSSIRDSLLPRLMSGKIRVK